MNLPGIYSLNKHISCIDRFSVDTLVAGSGALVSDDPVELLLLRTRLSKDGAGRLLDHVASVTVPVGNTGGTGGTGGGECLSVRTNNSGGRGGGETSLFALRTQRVVSGSPLREAGIYKLVSDNSGEGNNGDDIDKQGGVEEETSAAATKYRLEFVGEIPRADGMSAAGKPGQARDCRSLFWGPLGATGSGGGGGHDGDDDNSTSLSVAVAVDSLSVRWFAVAEAVVAEQAAVPLADADAGGAAEFFQLVQAATSDPHRPSVVAVARGPAVTAYDNRSSSNQAAVWSIDRAHQSVVCCLDFNPNVVNLMCTGGDDGVVRFWDLRKSSSGPCQHRRIAGYSRGFINSVSFHGIHDELVLVGADDGVAVVNAVSLSSSSSTSSSSKTKAAAADDDVDAAVILNQLVSNSLETRTAGFSGGGAAQSKLALAALRQEQLAMNDGLVQMDPKFPSSRAIWLSDSSDPILYGNLSPYAGDSTNRRVSVHDFGVTLKKEEE